MFVLSSKAPKKNPASYNKDIKPVLVLYLNISDTISLEKMDQKIREYDSYISKKVENDYHFIIIPVYRGENKLELLSLHEAQLNKIKEKELLKYIK